MLVERLTLGGPNEHRMRPFPVYALFTGASWIRGVGVSRPSCFSRGESGLWIDATLGLDVKAPPAGTAVRAESTAPDLRFEGALGNAGETHLRLVAGALADTVGAVDLELAWSHAGAHGGGWVEFDRTRPVRVLMTLDRPFDIPYDLAVEKACAYASGCRDAFAASLAICRCVARDVRYNPSATINIDRLLLLTDDCPTPCEAGCELHASLMKTLCRAIGIAVSPVQVWGGYTNAAKERVRTTYLFEDPVNGWIPVSMRVLAPQLEEAAENPHFSHHAQVGVGGWVFDPSYGTEGLVEVDAELDGMHRMTGNDWDREQESAWRCGHSPGVLPQSVAHALLHPTGPPAPAPSLAAVRVPLLVRVLADGLEPRRTDPSGEGFVRRFEAEPDFRFDITAALYSGPEEAAQSFRRLNRSIESPGGLGPPGVGDELRLWPRTREGGSAGLLYRRANLVLYLFGRFGQLEIAEVADRIHFATRPNSPAVTMGAPSLPLVGLSPGPLADKLPFVEWSRDERQLPLAVPALADGSVVLYAVSPETARIRPDPPALTFHPVQPGAQECVVAVLTPAGAVTRRSLRIEVGPAPA